MRGHTVLVSLIAHAAAIAGISRITVEPPDPEPELDVTRPSAIELVPIEFSLVPLAADPISRSTVVRSSAPLTARGTVERESVARVTTTTRSTPSSIESGGAEPVVSDRPNPLAMRGLRHDLALPRDIAEQIAAGGMGRPTEAPGEPRWSHDPKIKLVRVPGGKHEVRDRVATFRVARDGTVDVEDKPDFTIRLNIPRSSEIRRALVRRLDAWMKDPYLDTRAGPISELPRHLTAVPGACGPGDPMCVTAEDIAEQWALEDEEIASGAIISGKADISAALQRKLVGDPFASRKLKILDQTRDERARIGGEYRDEQLDRSAELVRRNLDALWRTERDPAKRRAALFALWDECAEGDDDAGRAGERARAMVIGWIRARLPAGAYSDAEIVELDARRTSKQHFAPYP